MEQQAIIRWVSPHPQAEQHGPGDEGNEHRHIWHDERDRPGGVGALQVEPSGRTMSGGNRQRPSEGNRVLCAAHVRNRNAWLELPFDAAHGKSGGHVATNPQNRMIGGMA